MMERKEKTIERIFYEKILCVGEKLHELITREEGPGRAYKDDRMLIVEGLSEIAEEKYESLLKG